MTNRQTLWFMASISFIVSTIAIGFAVIGAWPALPFAGLELLALGAALHVSRARVRETIHVDPVRVDIHRQWLGRLPLHGAGRGQGDGSFPTAWLRVRRSMRHGWYPRRLFVGASGRWIELGSFLNEEQRDLLGAEIEATVAWVLSRSDLGTAG